MKTQKRSRRSATTLPDDVAMEILSRMPALDVLKFRRVCRRWRDFISTQHFKEMHLKAKAYHSSMILFDGFESIKNEGALLMLDKWEKPTIHRFLPNLIHNSGSGLIDVKLSYDGLIITKSIVPVNGLWVFTLFNPISGDAVRIEAPTPGFIIYAMFFNPLIKEYCILLGKYGSESNIEFLMLNLGPQPCCRAVKQPQSVLIWRRNHPMAPPVVIDDEATIYWLVDSWIDRYPSCEQLIMTFDIKTDKFSFMSHPLPIHNCQGLKHKGMHIMKMNGRLSFFQSTIAHERTLRIINIWTLKDSATQLWTKTYSVSIDIGLDINPRFWSRYSYCMVIAVGNGELLLDGVCLYNLQLGTHRIIGTPYLEFIPNIFVFVPSFVSLRNCKPIIRI